MGLTQQREDEVAAANIVGEIAEKVAAMRVVAEILNDGSAISVGVSLFEIFASGSGKALKQHWADAVIPRSVDDGFVSQNRVPVSDLGLSKGKGKSDPDAQKLSCEWRFFHDFEMRERRYKVSSASSVTGDRRAVLQRYEFVIIIYICVGSR